MRTRLEVNLLAEAHDDKTAAHNILRPAGRQAEVVGNQWLLIKWYASLNQNRRDCKLEADAARQAYVTVRHHALPSLKINPLRRWP
jgi:hypothetical protein